MTKTPLPSLKNLSQKIASKKDSKLSEAKSLSLNKKSKKTTKAKKNKKKLNLSFLSKLKIKSNKKDKKIDSNKKKSLTLKEHFSKLSNLKPTLQTLSILERRIISVFIIIIVLSCSFLLYQHYEDRILFMPEDGGDYIEGTIGEPTYVNPILSQTSDIDMDLVTLIFSGLLKYDKNQELQPDLAEGYDISEDNKNYTFHLRKNVKWHDGKPFTADDVVFTIEVIKNPEYGSPLRPIFQNVAIEKLGDYTIKFVLTKDTYTPFLYENTTFGILPKHIWESVPPSSSSLSKFNLEPIGTGPFEFKEYKKDKISGAIVEYALEKNDEYYKKPAYLDTITFKIYDDQASTISAYNKKEINGVNIIKKEHRNNLKKSIESYTLKLPRYFSLFLNSSKNSTLNNQKIRQALYYGTNRDQIINEALDGQAVKVDTPILPNFLGHNPEAKKYEYNPEQAAELLHQAEYRDYDGDGIRNKDDTKLEFILTIPDQPEFIKIAEIVKQNWEELGIVVAIEPRDLTELQSEIIRPRNYQILLYGQLVGHDPDPFAFWHSDQRKDPGLNLTSLKDKTIDDLLETARKTANVEDRTKKYLHFQNNLTEQVPAIFLYSPTYEYGVNKKVKGIDLEYVTIPSDRFTNVTDWYMNTYLKWDNNK